MAYNNETAIKTRFTIPGVPDKVIRLPQTNLREYRIGFHLILIIKGLLVSNESWFYEVLTDTRCADTKKCIFRLPYVVRRRRTATRNFFL